VRAYVHLDQFEGRASFATWLARIAIHEARARAQRARRETAIDPGAAVATEARSSPSPELHALARELSKGLESAIAALPEHYRCVVMMRDLESLTTRETAELLEISEETVKVRLHRAHAMLKETLTASLGEPAVELFAFHAPRCDRVVSAVLRRLANG
jgi:RNA polymerase sigma-70 factor (ECF subfamily)